MSLHASRLMLVRTIFEVLYANFPVSAMSLIYRENSSGSANKIANLQGFFMLFTSVPMLGKKKNPRECVITGVEILYTGGSFLIHRTMGGAGTACFTFVGEGIILQVLVREPFHSSFSG